MLATYAVSDASSTVLGRLGDSSFSPALLLEFADNANSWLCNAAEWPFMEKTYTGTAASGNIFFDLQTTATDYQLPISISLNAPDASATPVTYKQHRDFFEEYPDPTALTAARPSIWSMFGTTLILGPAPLDQTYTFQLLYLKEPTPLTGDTSVFNVPNAFRELLILGMLGRAQATNDQYDLSQLTFQEFDIQYAMMEKRLLKRQSGTSPRMGRLQRRTVR
jgi:hypothetical protein